MWYYYDGRNKDEWNKESRDKLGNYDKLIFDESAKKIYKGGKTVYSVNGAETTRYPHTKEWNFTPTSQNYNSLIGKKWIYSERNTLNRQSGDHCRGQRQQFQILKYKS